MGNFYVNITVRGTVEQVTAVLRSRNRQAWLTGVPPGLVVVCDQVCDDQDLDEIASLALTLAVTQKGPALAVLNHDDDLLLLGLYGPAGLLAEHGWGKLAGMEVPRTSRSAFVEEVRRVFGTEPRAKPNDPAFPAKGLWRWFYSWVYRHIFAIAVHEEIVAAAGLPDCSVGAGYRSVERGDMKQLQNFIRV